MTRISQADWSILSVLLDEVLELPTDARPAWLAEHRISEPMLVAQLEELLEREVLVDRDEFLTERRAPPLPPVSTLAGQTLGAYVLERPLGQGGMGSVWLARRSDGRFLGVAAIKFLSLAVAGPAGEARFRREGSVLALLAHPNIARLLDAGVTPAGQPYLVLEYVDGQPLDAWCDTHRLPVEGRLRLFGQVMAAVAHAHANFIVHRDLKPANILVTADGIVKLLDFGIAKLLEEGQGSASALTGSHESVLTFKYASPEQIRGDPITAASDGYSLGVILYELLGGRHPTSGDSHTPAEHVVSILNTDPPQLSRAVTPSARFAREDALRISEARDASPEKLHRVFTGDLDNILSRALKKSAGERYPTVEALAEDIRRYLEHEPVAARPTSMAYRASRFIRRNRATMAVVSVAAAGLLAATGFSIEQMREARRQRDGAVRETLRADGVLQFQNQLISHVGDQPMTMRQIVDRGVELLNHRHVVDRASEAEVVLSLSSIYTELGDMLQARGMLARAESLAAADGQVELLTQIRCASAIRLTEMGRGDSASLEMAAYDRLARAGSRFDTKTIAICLDARATGQMYLHHLDSALITWQSARSMLEAQALTRSSTYLAILGHLGTALESENRMREVVALRQRSIAIQDSLGESGTYQQLVDQGALSFALLASGEVAEAERFSQQSGVQLELSPTPAYAVGIATNRASITFQMGWPDSSLVWFTRAAQFTEQLHSSSRERRALFGRGRAETALGRLSDARLTLNRIRGLRDSASASREELHLLAWLRRAEGNFSAADTALTMILERDGYFRGESDPEPGLRLVLIAAADVALKLGDAKRSLKLAGDARRIAAFDSTAESRSMYVGEARLMEARGYLAQGDTVQAVGLLSRALPALRVGAGPGHPMTRTAENLLASLRP
ncbi:MAG: serine/threonine-protein kinase [Gemmatimonadota bacterium]